MSLSERERNLIHSSTTVHEGRKYFGEFDYLVGQETITESFEISALASTPLSIIIPTMERGSRLERTLDRLTSSLTKAELATTLIIMDNSLLHDLLFDVKEKFSRLQGTPVARIIYHHDPRMTQSTSRNYAFKKFVDSSEMIGIWDSDIYCSQETISEVIDLWKTAPHMVGIAPPMGSYRKGEIEVELALYKDIRNNPFSRERLHMPGEIGEENGIWNGDILRTTMMRGAFFVRRSLIEAIARRNQDGEPWLKDFVVWQNVPFFLSARELDGDFGYAMSGEATVLHDDSADPLSISRSIPYSRVETLKSLSMLMVRNRVYSQIGRKMNTRFLRYNIPAIGRVTNFGRYFTELTQEALLSVSNFLVESRNPELFVDQWKNIVGNFPEEVVSAVDEVVIKLSKEDIFSRVKNLKSLSPQKPMYTV